MRGLAFPQSTAVDRDASAEYGTPVSNVDDIPIDPALGGSPPIDPALMMKEKGPEFVQVQPQQDFQPQPPPFKDYQVRQYSQGPQGDPFAPQVTAPLYYPMEQEEPLPAPKAKRRRKVRREEECSFCQGNDTRNKLGGHEQMVTCHECGRSGHPSCMELEKQAEVMRSYPWKCIECKNCEVCLEKGDDERILFCDWCDRGWHLDCMIPALENPPEGAWFCPGCVPNPPMVGEGQYSLSEDIPPSSERGQSVASTSRSTVEESVVVKHRGRKRGSAKRKNPPKAIVASEDSDGGEEEEEIEETPVVFRGRGRPRTSTKKARANTVSSDGGLAETPIRTYKRKRLREASPPPPTSIPRVRLRIPPQRGTKGKEREEEEPHGLFDDILSLEERDTAKTTITNWDKQYFHRSRQAAENKIVPPPPPPPPLSASSRLRESIETSTPLRARPLRSAALQQIATTSSTPLDLNSPGPSTPGGPLAKFEPGVLRIRTIRFGEYDIKTWYDAPFPEEYATIPDGRLWICEFCLKYMRSRFGAGRHRTKCKAKHPPGDEIYRDNNISIFEVDGRRNKIYCQNLCLLSKMFLDHKSLFYDVEPFLFYVITEVDDVGARFVGYFSKEKRCPKDYNLSCIMTLPVRQRQGWGNLLIDFSYLLSKIEQRSGSPEKPLSSLGALGYRNYWTLAVMRFLEAAPDSVRLEEISSATSMTLEDVCITLMQQNMIFIREASLPPVRPSPGQSIKFPKGRKNGVARKHLQRLQTKDKDPDSNAPFVVPKNYEIHFDRNKVDAYLRRWESKGYLKLRPEKLQWTPYIVTRTSKEGQATHDLPAMDTFVDASQSRPATNGISHPPTPAPADVTMVDELLSYADEEDEALPSRRARTRSGMRSPAKEQPRKRRSTRSPSPLHMPSPAPLSRSLRSNRTNQTKPSSPVPIEEANRSVRRRKSSRKEDVVDLDDEETSAKFAIQEQVHEEQQRSRRSEMQAATGKPEAMAPTPQISTRKRRRIESPPEIEEESVGLPPQVSPHHPPVNGDEPVNDTAGDPANGGNPPKSDANSDVPTPEMIVYPVAPKTNGHIVDADDDEAAPSPETFKPATPPTLCGESHPNGFVVKEVVNSDIKSEDAGTPYTNLTSRQSVPSDDTILMVPETTPEVVKCLSDFGEFQGPVHAESDLRSTLNPEANYYMFDMEDCHDEDADGEYDEDAEGEPDTELLMERAY